MCRIPHVLIGRLEKSTGKSLGVRGVCVWRRNLGRSVLGGGGRGPVICDAVRRGRGDLE